MYTLERKTYGLKVTLGESFSDEAMSRLTADLKREIIQHKDEPMSVIVDIQASAETAVHKLIYILDATRNN